MAQALESVQDDTLDDGAGHGVKLSAMFGKDNRLVVPAGRPALAQPVRTTTVLGFLRVWLLGRLRLLRPRPLRDQRESALMDRWEPAVREAAALDGGLALELAEEEPTSP